MDVETILILFLAMFVALSLWRLGKAIRNCWDGEIDDLFEEVVVRRLAIFGLATVALVAVLTLRGPLRSLLGLMQG